MTSPHEPRGPRPQWVPPQQQYPPYAFSSTPYGAPPRPPRPPKGRVSGWIWLGVGLLALLLGLTGGFAGGMLEDQINRQAGSYEGGLDDVDLETEAPLPPAVSGGTEESVIAVAETLLPSTVQILAESEGNVGGATGSGFVLDRQGHVVTNNHVVAQAAEQDGTIEIVDSEGNRHDATVVGRSPTYDLAVLHSADLRSLPPAALGSSRALRVGEGVVAIGSPLGLSSTVTSGIVSALQRPVTVGDQDDASFINAVQTDAAINPGNSGGPLVDLRGRVVGVNSAIATAGGFGIDAGNIGVGFAIPIEQVRITADQILRTGEARYPVMGATVETGNPDGTGARIEEVAAGTPAAEAGLENDDVVIAVEGDRVADGIELIVVLRTFQPGDTVELTVRRDRRELTVPVTLAAEVG